SAGGGDLRQRGVLSGDAAVSVEAARPARRRRRRLVRRGRAGHARRHPRQPSQQPPEGRGGLLHPDARAHPGARRRRAVGGHPRRAPRRAATRRPERRHRGDDRSRHRARGGGRRPVLRRQARRLRGAAVARGDLPAVAAGRARRSPRAARRPSPARVLTGMHVAARLMRMLKEAGVDYLFGNPGTTELPFLDALDGSGIDYVVALQEATAVAAADGYAQASGRLGVVNLHVAPGVANGLSILHNAARARTPLLVTAGQQDTRLLLGEPILAADMVQLTEQLTKWSHEVRSASEAPAALRRAISLAQTPPTGPVFLSLPMDLMSEPVDDVDAGSTSTSVARTEPDGDAVARAAALLGAARAPVIVAGDGVARAGARAELRALAELVGAAVHGEPIHRRLSFPADHPLWRGGLFPAAASVRKSLERADCVLVVGASVFTWLFHTPGSPFRPGLPLIQLDDDGREIGRTYPVDCGIDADVRRGLAALHTAVAGRLGVAERVAADARAAVIGRARREHAARLAAEAEAAAARTPISPAFLMHTLASVLPPDAAVVDESASSLPHVLRHLPFGSAADFFGSKTGTLGWAMGAALGVQLACPGR